MLAKGNILEDEDMVLYKGDVGKAYRIEDTNIDDKIKRRLEVMGLTNGTQIEILNKNINGSLILKVRGSRFAIGKRIAEGIDVV